MYFNSPTYAIFLPIVFCLYWFVFGKNLKWQNLFVLVASYVFYGWWDWRFLLLIALTSFCSYWSGILIEKFHGDGRKAKMVSAANIILNLGILGLFKYYDFFAESFANLFLGGRSDRLLLHLILPVGISFYTFQALSYTIDVYRKRIEPTRNVVQFFAYVSFFPQLVAGPIERASNLLPQFAKERAFQYSEAVDGLRQMLWGFFKKVVVADQCARFVDDTFANYNDLSSGTLLLGAIFFAFQIYGDFSGYSDIAIGSAKLFGIRLRPNFRVPYFSRDIAEFWRRWHISLTTWFRDYVYIPLGGSRCSKAKVIRNTFIIFLLSGLWHGANWTFLAWGGYHALLFMPLILKGKNRRYKEVVAVRGKAPSLKEICQIVFTFFLVTIGWVLFRSDSIPQALDYFLMMVRTHESKSLINGIATVPHLAVMASSILVMLFVEWTDRDQEHGLWMQGLSRRGLRWVIYCALVLAIILFFDRDASQFIYFQF